MTHEEVPLADIFRAVVGLISGRRDAVIFGAQAVNAHVLAGDERMTSDIDVISTDAEALAEEIRACLAKQFHIAVRVRPMTKKGAGFRVHQSSKPKHRSLVDVRQEEHLPDFITKRRVRFVEEVTLLAMKVECYAVRRNQIKGDTDRADIRRLLVRYPKLRELRGEVTDKLRSDGASSAVLEIWYEFVREKLDPDSDEY